MLYKTIPNQERGPSMNNSVTRIWVITHADTYEGPDPDLCASGKAIIMDLSHFLPENISQVISGFGLRHRGIAKVLGKEINSYHLIAGTAIKLEETNHQIVILGDGTEILREKLNRFGLTDLAQTFVKSLPDNSLICTGRPFIRYLGAEAFSASLYQIIITGQVIRIKLIHCRGDEGAKEKEA